MLISNKKILFLLLVLAIVVSVGFPLMQISKYESVISNGTSYKVKCTAYDPYDPFMGRYVRLRLGETILKSEFEPIESEADKHRFWHRGYVEIYADKDGFVQYRKLIDQDAQLDSTKDYLKCNIHERYRTEEDIENEKPAELNITIDGINRYYMNEKLAKPAEDAIREIFRNRTDNDSTPGPEVYIELKVLHNSAVPVQLYIGQTKIEEYVAK